MSKEREVIESMIETREGMIDGYGAILRETELSEFGKSIYSAARKEAILEKELLETVLKMADEDE